MPRSIALDPVVTRSGTTKVVVPPIAKTTSQALDPRVRLFDTTTGFQYVAPDVAE
jgi:hypothetical protein